MKMILKAVIVLTFAIFALHSFAEDLQWIEGSNQSCPDVCMKDSEFPVGAGVHTGNGAVMYVCAANTSGEGYRPGFNNASNRPKTCYTAYGDHAILESSFKCLCYKKPVSIK